MTDIGMTILQWALQWTAGLAGVLLILYKFDSYSLVIKGITGFPEMARVSLGYWFYSFTILLAGTVGNLLCAFALLHLFFDPQPLGHLFAISGIMIIFACLPEKILGWLRKLNDWYLAQKAGE